jgi:SAM-dependent methyltransferase
MHLNSILLFKKHVLPRIVSGMRILEIGPDKIPSTLQKLVEESLPAGAAVTWETLDMASRPGVTYGGTDEYSFPISDATFDIVIAVQVIEHVRKVWLWVPEVSRVCKKDGLAAFIGPISWPYHEAPVDCWRIFPDGMKALCEESRLEILVSQEEALEVAEHRELLGYGRTYPGVSCSNMRVSGRIKNIIRRLLLQPIPFANDVITVARKM